MQNYAACINLIYSKELTGSTLIGAKILVALALIGTVYGFYRARTADRTAEDLSDYFFMPFIGAIGFPFIALCISGFFYGLYWLFT